MGSSLRRLDQLERDEIARAFCPLLIRYSQRFGVPPAAIVGAALWAMPPASARRHRPADYAPKHPVVARVLRALATASKLSAGTIVEEDHDDARRARDVLVYVCRASCNLPFGIIGAAIGQDHDAVMDGYCRVIGLLENDDPEVRALVSWTQQGVGGQ